MEPTASEHVYCYRSLADLPVKRKVDLCNAPRFAPKSYGSLGIFSFSFSYPVCTLTISVTFILEKWLEAEKLLVMWKPWFSFFNHPSQLSNSCMYRVVSYTHTWVHCCCSSSSLMSSLLEANTQHSTTDPPPHVLWWGYKWDKSWWYVLWNDPVRSQGKSNILFVKKIEMKTSHVWIYVFVISVFWHASFEIFLLSFELL